MQLTNVLARPSLHLVAGLLFAVVFTWPLLSIEQPIDTWYFLYASWGVSIVVSGLFSLGVTSDEEAVDDDEDEEED